MSALNPGCTGLSEIDPLTILRPIVRNREARHTGTRIKVVELNAFGGRRFEEIVALLERPPLQNPDIVLLCEMDWQMPRTSNLEIPDEIAKRLGMSMAYGPEFAFRRKEVEFRSFFGNAILSSAPLEDVSIVPVPVLFDWSAKFMRQGFGSLVRIGARAVYAPPLGGASGVPWRPSLTQ